jgi:hypothetical protein
MSRRRRQKGPQAFIDLHRLEEDHRIATIGHTVTAHHKTVAVMVEIHERDDDSDPAGAKGDRYIRKIRERFSEVVVLERFNGPVAGVESIKFGPVSPENN